MSAELNVDINRCCHEEYKLFSFKNSSKSASWKMEASDRKFRKLTKHHLSEHLDIKLLSPGSFFSFSERWSLLQNTREEMWGNDQKATLKEKHWETTVANHQPSVCNFYSKEETRAESRLLGQYWNSHEIKHILTGKGRDEFPTILLCATKALNGLTSHL